MSGAAGIEVLAEGPSFRSATTWKAVGPGAYRGRVGEEWSQGRAVFGGIVGAGMARAMSDALPEDKTLRSFALTFAGPVEPGELNCTTELVREGKSASFVSATLVQGGTARATATGTFARARKSSVPIEGPPRPDAPAPSSVASMPYIAGVTPRFTQRVETKYVRGGFPFTGSDSPVLGGWCRFRDDDHPGDTVGVIGLLDAWPAPAITMLRVPAPSSSITWNVDLAAVSAHHRLDEWWYWEGHTTFVGDGYSSFDASLWAPDGTFVARSRQLVGVFER